MNLKNVAWLKISGVSGVLAPLVAFTFISLAITSHPQFSWTGNALSDLGVVEGVTAVLFNSGLIIGGILAIIFASGLFIFLRNRVLGRIGAFIFTLAALALVAIGFTFHRKFWKNTLLCFGCVFHVCSNINAYHLRNILCHGESENGRVHFSSCNSCGSRLGHRIFNKIRSGRRYSRSSFCSCSVNVGCSFKFSNA